MRTFKNWLEDTHDEPQRDFSPEELHDDDGSYGSHKFEVEEIGYIDSRPAIPGLPTPRPGTTGVGGILGRTGKNEIYQIVYDIDFTITKGMTGYSPPGERQMTPDDPDEYALSDVEVEEVNHEKFNKNHPILKTFNISLMDLHGLLIKYFNGYLYEEAMEEAEDHHRH